MRRVERRCSGVNTESPGDRRPRRERKGVRERAGARGREGSADSQSGPSFSKAHTLDLSTPGLPSHRHQAST